MAPHAQNDQPHDQPHQAASSKPPASNPTAPIPAAITDVQSTALTTYGPPTFATPEEERHYLKARLALAFRIFARSGFEEGVAGHITVRDPIDPTSFWVNPFGRAFALMRSRDLLRVSHDGQILNHGATDRLLNTAAYRIHSAVHTARPDVMCAAHSHSLAGRTFCSLGRELDMLTQDSCAFYNDHAVYRSFNGVVLAEEEGRNVAAALGDKKAALLQNHGLLTVGKTIEEVNSTPSYHISNSNLSRQSSGSSPSTNAVTAN